MSTGTQSTFCMLSVPSPLSLDPILLDETSNIPQLVKNSKPIHVQVQIPQPVYTEPTTYPESAYQWVTEVLCEEFHAAITDFNEAIRIAPDYTEAYANRGMAKVGLDHIDEAKSDLQTAMELAEHKGNKDLKTFAEVKLQQLNDSTSQTDKTTLTEIEEKML